MPLLVCPNDNTSMQAVNRSGVEFDFCPTCRGVWLDRGELEKLMSVARDEAGPEPAPQPAPQSAPWAGERPSHYQRPPQYQRPEYRGDDDDDRDYDDRRGRRRRGSSIFDIFD